MLIIKNSTAMQFWPPWMREGVDIVIENGLIKDLAPGLAERYPGAEVIDANGKIVVPGLVCAHHHYYSGLARGVLAKIKRSTDFVSQLQNLWWKLDRALDEESVYYSGIICSLEAIKAGTTSVIDHHSSQNFITGSLLKLKEGFVQAGLRGLLCFEVTDRNGPEKMEEGIDENVSFIKCETIPEGLVKGMFGGHAPFTIPDEGLKKLGHLCEVFKRGFHVHVGEDKYDSSFSHAKYGKDLLKRLEEFGLVNEKSVFGHGTHFTDADRDRANKAGSFVVHNCASNMNNNVGYNHHLQDIKNVALGTDGITGDMFETMRTSFFKHRDAGGPLWPESFLQYLCNGNILMERHFGGKFGHLQPDYRADLVILDYQSPTPLSPGNIGGHMAFGMGKGDVDTVIIDGKIVYRDRKFPGPVEEIYREAQKAAAALWKRMDQLK